MMVAFIAIYISGLVTWLLFALVAYLAPMDNVERTVGRKMLLNTLWWPLTAVLWLGKVVLQAVLEEREGK